MDPIYDQSPIYSDLPVSFVMNLMEINARPVEELLENFAKVYDLPCPRHSLTFGFHCLSLLPFIESKPLNLLLCPECHHPWDQ